MAYGVSILVLTVYLMWSAFCCIGKKSVRNRSYGQAVPHSQILALEHFELVIAVHQTFRPSKLVDVKPVNDAGLPCSCLHSFSYIWMACQECLCVVSFLRCQQCRDIVIDAFGSAAGINAQHVQPLAG